MNDSISATTLEEKPQELSAREIELLRLVATGATNQQIALQLGISINTVKAHMRNIFGKLGVLSRTEATLYAIQHGLVTVEQPGQAEGAPTEAPDASALGTAAHKVSVLSLPPAHLLPWHMRPMQYVALALAFVVVVAVAIWPSGQVASPPDSRLIDVPRTVAVEATLESSSRWRTRVPMPFARGRFAIAESGGLVYTIGGLSEEGWSREVEAYDPLNDRWERHTNKPIAVANVGAATVGSLIYVPGGLDEANQVTSVVEAYDPQTDTWKTVAPLPKALCAYAIAPYGEGFYVLGGWDGQRYLDSVYYYDATRDVWQEQGKLTRARGFAAAAVAGERIYLVGGYDGASDLRLAESFAPALAATGSSAWQELAPMNVARAGQGVALVDGYLYVVGGGWDGQSALNERYDIANNLWSTFDSPIAGAWRNLGVIAVATKDGSVLLAMGGWNSGKYLNLTRGYQATYRLYNPFTR